MEHRPLGRTGVSVSKLCLGAMMFGDWGNKDHDESIRIIHRALDAGINFVDTADVYSRGESEEIVGKALAGGRRDDVVLATKLQMPMGEDPNQRGNSRRWIIREVEDSLRRLNTVDRSIRSSRTRPSISGANALNDLVRQGRVRISASTFPPSAIVRANGWPATSACSGLSAACRARAVRGIESDVLPPVPDTGWASSVGRWPADGYRVAGAGRLAISTRAERFRDVTTCHCPLTSASSTRPNRR
jgi:aryl-alcohol dehydrogenase-like predicted oxidoreductase